jgi:kynurenine formamidase
MCLAETLETVSGQLAPHQAHHAPPISRRTALAGGLGAAVGALVSPGAAATASHRRPRMRDLTWTFSPSFPVFVDGEEATRSTHVTIEDDGYYLQRWTFYEHTATHMDAPGHFTPGGRLSPEITLDELFVPAVVIDISDKVRADHDAEVTVDDLIRFERRHGRIPRKAAVLMYSGWETRAGSTDLYRGTDAGGVYHFPGFDVEAIDWLVERRDITGIGVDTMSLDHGPSTTFEVHVTLLGADRWGLENLRNTSTIPPRGTELFVGLIPWEEGSGGPCRVVARW